MQSKRVGIATCNRWCLRKGALATTGPVAAEAWDLRELALEDLDLPGGNASAACQKVPPINRSNLAVTLSTDQFRMLPTRANRYPTPVLSKAALFEACTSRISTAR